MAFIKRPNREFLEDREDYSVPSNRHERSEPYDVDPEWSCNSKFQITRLPCKKYTKLLSPPISADLGSIDSLFYPSEPFLLEDLPIELIEKILREFFKEKCPKLSEILDTGRIPLDSEPDGLHTNSDLIQYRIRMEQAELVPYMRTCPIFFNVISQMMIRGSVYISGTRAFQRLIEFAGMRDSGVLGNLRGADSGAVAEIEEISLISALPRDTSPKVGNTFDVTGAYGNWGFHRDLVTNWHPKGWEMYPSWLTAGSCCTGGHLNRHGNMQPLNELPVNLPFMETIDTLILGSGPESWRLETELVYIGDTYEEWPDLDHGSPALYTIVKAFQSLGKGCNLRKLVMAGNIMKNTFWFIPREAGGINPFSNLTHLTLSISESPGKHNSPVELVRGYLKTPHDSHICTLLTGKSVGDNSMGDFELPFTHHLKYLHLRGPGAHLCSDFFEVEWEALTNLIVEMGTHRGVCNANPGSLVEYASAACEANPLLEIQIFVRICAAEDEIEYFSHHWWRRYGETVLTCQTIAEKQAKGEVMTLFEKSHGASSVPATNDQLEQLTKLISDEKEQAVQVSNFLKEEGIDVNGSIYASDYVLEFFRSVEREGEETQEGGDPDYWVDEKLVLELRAHADAQWELEAKKAAYYYWVSVQE